MEVEIIKVQNREKTIDLDLQETQCVRLKIELKDGSSTIFHVAKYGKQVDIFFVPSVKITIHQI